MKKIVVFTLWLIPIFAASQDNTHLWRIRLQPEHGQIGGNNRVSLRIIADLRNNQTNDYAGSIEGNGWSFENDTIPPKWFVNGIPNGNQEVGFIQSQDGYHMTYTAPSLQPLTNPVEVIATYQILHIRRLTIFNLSLRCNIHITARQEFRLDPDSAWIRINAVNDTVPLTIVEENENIRQYPTSPYYTTLQYYHDTLRGEGWYLNARTPKPPEWTVNGIPNGNNLVGQIIRNGPHIITFKAPIRMPVENPVEVIASYDSIYWNNKWRSKMKLTAHIWIVDSDTSSENDEVKNDTKDIKGNVGGNRFEVKMVATLIGGSNAAWGGTVTYSDEGSFMVSLEAEKAVVTNIKNNLEVLTNNCAKIILNPTTCTGMLHVAGIKSTKVTPANPPGQPYPIVEIWFVPHPTELTQFKFTCPPPPSANRSSIGKVDMSQMAMMAMARMPALPPYLKFIAKDGEQVIMEKGSPGSEIYYRFSVRKVKEE